MDWKERIITDPKILAGKPVIKGTYLTVESIVNLLTHDWTEQEILQEHPILSHEDIRACESIIQLVENIIENIPNSVTPTLEIQKLLPEQVNSNTLREILVFLAKCKKIAVGSKGITWIQNDNENLRKVVREGWEL